MPDDPKTQPHDARPVYEPPRVLRMDDLQTGKGYCGTPGSGASPGCDLPGISAERCDIAGTDTD